MGAPVGSLLVGSQAFIHEATRYRKALGGGMRQAGIIAAAGILSLTKGPLRLIQDHTFTKQLAAFTQEIGFGVLEVDLDTVETNMIMLKVRPESGATPASIVARLAKSTAEEKETIGKDIRLLAYPMTSVSIRIVVHCNNTEDDINLAKEKLKYVLNELRENNTK